MTFTATCIGCMQVVLSDVPACGPSVVTDRLRDLGALLHHVQVATTAP